MTALYDFGAARRRFLASGVLGAAAAGFAGNAKAQYASGTGRDVPFNCKVDSVFNSNLPVYSYTCNPVSDISLLTLALNLEYLEASFYLFATTGSGLPVTDTGDQPREVTGGRRAVLGPVVSAYARELATEERKHVELLRTTIANMGMVPVSLPLIDFDAGFNYIMRQAGVVAANANFDAFANDQNFLLAAYTLEDLLVSAYRGAVPFISNRATLDSILGLLGAEGYHAGIVRTLLFQRGLASATNAISSVRYNLDGTAGLPNQGNDHGVGTTAAPTISNVDAGAIVEGRTTQQVIDITFDGSAASSPTLGLPRFFFSDGLSSPH